MLHDASDGDDALDAVVVSVDNDRVGPLLTDLEKLPDLHVSFQPHGVLALTPPPAHAAERVRDVSVRSPIEVYLGGIQSVGSWQGFLGYAAAAGAVVWIGLYADTTYLLTAAMLIAPFAGPAMNAAVATASGDGSLLRRALLRYVAGLGTAIAVAWALSLAWRLETASPLMINQSQSYVTALLLPLSAGFAGALHLIQSERSSLVSGAAVGILVAASLTPPAGIIGMGLALGRWELIGNALFVLALQLAGINFAGSLTLRLFGLTERNSRFEPGSRRVFAGALGLSVLAAAGLVAFQAFTPVTLERIDLVHEARTAIERTVREDGAAVPVDVDVRFPRPESAAKEMLLAQIYVVPGGPGGDALAARLERAVAATLQRRWPTLRVLVTVTVLAEAPAATASLDEPPRVRRR